MCESSEQVIRRDVLVKQHSLNERRAKARGLLMQKDSVHFSGIEQLCSGVFRRTPESGITNLIELNPVQIKGYALQSNHELVK